MALSHALRFARSVALLGAVSALGCSTPPSLTDASSDTVKPDVGADAVEPTPDASIDDALSEASLNEASVDADGGTSADAAEAGPDLCVGDGAANDPGAAYYDASQTFASGNCPASVPAPGSCCTAPASCRWTTSTGSSYVACNCVDAGWQCNYGLIGPCPPPELALAS